MNIYDLISRAQKLRQETKLDSVSPDRVGALCEDTLKYINEYQLLASSPSLHKIYASVSAMQSDPAPKSDLTGKALKPGQLVVIVPASQTDATAGDVYRYDGPSGSTSAWTFVAKLGAVPADAELNATSANPVQNKVVTEKLTELESEKQDVLVDGENIKTINGRSILGKGNIIIPVGEGGTFVEEIYIGDTEPTDDTIKVWINPNEGAVPRYKNANGEWVVLRAELKTINGQSILGKGDLKIDIKPVDSELSTTSTNPVQNKVVSEALNSLNAKVDDALICMTNITYGNLCSLKSTKKLIPGMWYRITDYTTTTIQENTQSAHHDFDVIVLATDVDTLSETARAIKREGDTYFTENGADLEAWQIWYCLENDTARFAWADAANGKGVIWRMIDEKGNDCPYDFKNIMFVRYKLNVPTYDTTSDYPSAAGEIVDYEFSKNQTLSFLWAGVSNNTFYWVDPTGALSLFSSSPTGETKLFYTFSNCSDMENVLDYSLTQKCYGNKIGAYRLSYVLSLNNNVFFNLTDKDCYHNVMGIDCYNNSFAHTSYQNDLGDSSYFNVVSSNFYANTFDNSFSRNAIGSNCTYNYVGVNFNRNFIGRYFTYNVCGCIMVRSIIRFDCSYSNFEGYCSQIWIDNRSRYNHFGAKYDGVKIKNSDTSNYIQYYRFSSNLSGTISVTRNRSIETYVGKNSSGTIKEFCLADKA